MGVVELVVLLFLWALRMSRGLGLLVVDSSTWCCCLALGDLVLPCDIIAVDDDTLVLAMLDEKMVST